MRKRTAQTYKTVKHGGANADQITTVRPEVYGKRLLDFLPRSSIVYPSPVFLLSISPLLICLPICMLHFLYLPTLEVHNSERHDLDFSIHICCDKAPRYVLSLVNSLPLLPSFYWLYLNVN
uniref:PIPK domain-containing protein n=1 Tax=Rodentolepis nana TaxID=102285 RepID=A0A0R3U006_RODNA